MNPLIALVEALTVAQQDRGEAVTYYFQNPSTGFPMYLTNNDFGSKDDGTPRVELETLDGAKASAEDVADQAKYNQAIAHCERIHQAALVLFRYHGCKDILT